ncbi:hypothetical protein L1987_08052 [Smallanthus sonchifolius]|uniref:Uncharacterized protein n=1 Tax=Smallanthus sonchifolius TaxID=185202 RepID=A0ACB9JJZ1_9ASTR|nr:hypothetical protein L1987_08052 [Smallanthus sonchifolius]
MSDDLYHNPSSVVLYFSQFSGMGRRQLLYRLYTSSARPPSYTPFFTETPPPPHFLFRKIRLIQVELQRFGNHSFDNHVFTITSTEFEDPIKKSDYSGRNCFRICHERSTGNHAADETISHEKAPLTLEEFKRLEEEKASEPDGGERKRWRHGSSHR